MLSNAHICADIATGDLERARAFYEGVLGLVAEHSDNARGVYYRASGGTMLNLYVRDAQPVEQTAATFLVADIDAMAGLRARGVVFKAYDETGLRTHDGVFEDDTGFKASWFNDPDGNILGPEQLP